MDKNRSAGANLAGVGPLYAQISHLAAPLNTGAFVRLHRRVEQAALLVAVPNGSEL